jgi:hypothetical protein
MSFPTIPQDLMRVLDANFPDTMPDVKDSVKQVRLKQGQQQVLRFLKSHFKAQQENPNNVCIRQ